MPEESSLSRPEVKFNMAISFLNRLNDLLKDCNDLSREKDIVSWRDTLKCIYREIYPLMEEKEITNHKRIMKEIYEIDIHKNPNTNFDGFKINREAYNKLGTKLDDWELLLRKIMHNNKLYLAEKDSPMEAIGDMSD